MFCLIHNTSFSILETVQFRRQKNTHTMLKMYQFSAPTSSPQLLTQAEHLGKWIHERTKDTDFPNSNRVRVSVSLLQHSLDIADATTFLLKNNLSGPALALARPLLESYMRGLWVLLCATGNADIDDFLAHSSHPQWSIKRLAKKLRNGAVDHYPWIELALSELEELHDVTHAGFLHVAGHLTETAIQPNYHRPQLDALLERGIEVRIRIACELFALLKDAESIESLHHLVSKFNRKPI